MATLVNVKQFAERHGCARKTVYDWEARGWIIRDGRKICQEESDALVARYRDTASVGISNNRVEPAEAVPKPPKPPKPPPPPKPPKPPLDPLPPRPEMLDFDEGTLADGRATTEEARRVKENFIALGKKLEYEQTSGNLIDLEIATRLLFDEFRAVRNHWLGWPAISAARIAADLNVEADLVTEVLTRYVHKHTSALSEPSASFGR